KIRPVKNRISLSIVKIRTDDLLHNHHPIRKSLFLLAPGEGRARVLNKSYRKKKPLAASSAKFSSRWASLRQLWRQQLSVLVPHSVPRRRFATFHHQRPLDRPLVYLHFHEIAFLGHSRQQISD